MTKDRKKLLANLKRKLGRKKYRDFAELVYERKLARVSPRKVKEEVDAKFKIDLPPAMTLIKH
jgi:hypothetical protein